LFSNLQNQVAEFHRSITNITEAVTLSRDRELSWVYAMEGNPIEFQKQSPKILDATQKRAENIVKELNPEHPRDLGPTNPA